MAWKANQLQGVLFILPGGSQLDALDTWKLVANGSTPEAFQRPGGSPVSGSQAQGSFRGHQLIIGSSLGRIDFFLSQSPGSSGGDEPPTITDFPAALSVLTDVMASALGNLRAVRIALVGSLSEIIEKQQDASAKLTYYTDGVWFPETAQDSVYQINVPVPFASNSNLLMNRALTWSAGFIQFFNGSFDPTSIVVPRAFKSTPIVTWKIDLNSLQTDNVSEYALNLFKDQCEEFKNLIRDGIRRVK